MGIKYSTIAISGYNAAPPSDSGAQTDENKIKWSTHKTKIGDPLNAAIVAIDSALVTAFAQEALLKTANYTTTAGDHAKLIEVTGSNTISLLDASTGGAGYQINVLNTGVGVVPVSRATGANTINGVAGNWNLDPGNGASFRVNSTLNGYDVVATALTSGGRLTDVVKTTGNETIAGIKTFSSPIVSAGSGITGVVHDTGNETVAGLKTLTGNLKLSNAGPFIDFRETGATLPAGLWEIQATTSTIRLYRNTAAAGDFSTFTNPIIFGADDTITVVGKIAGIDGTAATHLVTKAQLDAKVYGGQVTNAGTAAIPYGPSGWTVSRSSLGTVVVTHNLGTTNYAPVPASQQANTTANVTTLAANSFTVQTMSGGSLSDTGFTFTVARN